MIGPKTTLVLKRTIIIYDNYDWHEELITIKSIKGVLSTISGDEVYAWSRLVVAANHYFYMDYPKGFTVKETDNFWLGEREFDIKYIMNLGANQNNRFKIVLDEIW